MWRYIYIIFSAVAIVALFTVSLSPGGIPQYNLRSAIIIFGFLLLGLVFYAFEGAAAYQNYAEQNKKQQQLMRQAIFKNLKD